MPFDPDLSGPQFIQLFWPMLRALKALGGSARPVEVRDLIAAELGVAEDEKTEELPSGGSRFANRVAWSRFYLAKAGFIDSSRRGVWTLTDTGRGLEGMDHDAAVKVFQEIHVRFSQRAPQLESNISSDDEAGSEGTTDAAGSEFRYRHEILSVLMKLPPNGFERFCQRFLRESGFQEVRVTGKSGDGGIDGIGILEVNALVTFKVLFQCKRYRGSVSSSQIRDFRGAMLGRADKGIILTTGTFTSDARKEAVRDGVPPIELVDGEKLVDMLENLSLGLVPVQAYSVDKKFFDEFSAQE